MTNWHGGDAPTGTIPENYERFFVPSIGAPVAEDLIAAAALRPGDRVLDVACGTGVVTRLAADRVGDSGMATGLDINPGMLAVARSTTPAGTTIDWHEASAESMPLADASFDVVLCQMGLQFMPDPVTALGEMRRVLVDGGRLALNVPGPTPELFVILASALGRHVGPEAAGFVNRVFSIDDAAELGDLAASAGFADVEVRAGIRVLPLPAPADFLWQYLFATPLAGALAGMDDTTRDDLEREVVGAWQPFVVDGALRLEARVLTATARKGQE